MRNFYFLVLLWTTNAFALSIGGQSAFWKRQSDLYNYTFNFMNWMIGNGGKVADPAEHAPRRQVLPSEIAGAKKIKIRSGPYNVPHMGLKSQSGHAGMLENWVDTAIEKPCSGDECVILRQVGGLEYVDGTNANLDTGMWLHHMIHAVVGPTRWDPVGYSYVKRTGQLCVAHLAVMSTALVSERPYVVGNERTRIDYFQGNDTNVESGTGYHIMKDDKFAFIIELMNMNMENKVAYVTMTYDIIDGPLPPTWKTTKTVFLDANSCRSSDVEPPQETGNFTISSKPWIPSLEGKIVWTSGHLHDGGLAVDIKTNATNSMCTSKAAYSESPEYVFRGTAMGTDKVAKDHISSMSGCNTESWTVDEVRRDQSWFVEGKYDYDAREGNKENGKQSDIMAVSMVVVAVEPGVKPLY